MTATTVITVPAPFRISFACIVLVLLLASCEDRHPAADTSKTAASPATDEASASVETRRAPASPARPDLDRIHRLDDAPPPVADTTPVDTRILEVQLSDNSDGKRLTGITTDRFKSSDGVFLSIRTKGTANKYTLSSRWLDPTGKQLTEYSQVIATAGQTDTVFSLSKPDGWPKGRYQVELSINGKPLRRVPFTVQ